MTALPAANKVAPRRSLPAAGRMLVLAAPLLAAALSGCVDVGFDVRVANATSKSMTVHVWINETGGAATHFEGVVANGTEKSLGHFKAPKGDYSVHVRAGALSYREEKHYVGPASADLKVEITPSAIKVSQGTKRQLD